MGNRKKVQLVRVYPETALGFGHSQGQGEGDRTLLPKDESPKDLGLFECKPDINIDNNTSVFVEEHSPRIATNPLPIPISEVSVRQQAFMINNAKKKRERKENPPDLYTQLLYGGVGPPGSKGKSNKTKSVGEFLKNLGRKVCCRNRVAKEYFHDEIQREMDVGDEDEAIFTPRRRKKKIKRQWRRLDTLKLLLRIFVVIDYLFAWFQYWRSRLGSAENEFAHLQGIYNCEKTPTTAGIGDQVIEVVRVINAFLSFLVLFVSNDAHNTTICAYWIGGRWIQSLLHTLEYFWLTRFLNDPDLATELTWYLMGYLAFNAIGMFIVCLFYYEYSDIIKSRVNRLRSSRVLNREIDAKHLDEFSQRKAAVRYAGNYQSTLLIKKQIREAMKDRGDPWDLRDPKPEECQFALDEGIRAYKYFRGIPTLKIEETGQKIQRKIYLRRMRNMRKSLGIEESRLISSFNKLKAGSVSVSMSMSSVVGSNL